MSQSTRTRLLNAAVYRYGRDGFHRTATARVAADAEVSTGTLFRHFPSLEELVLAAYHRATQQLDGHWTGRPPRTTAYDHVRGRWEAALESALAAPDAFRYYALYNATPGYGATPRSWDPPANPVGGRWAPWRTLGPFLARASGEPAGRTDLLARVLEAQWTVTVEMLLLHGTLSLKPEARALAARLFDGWWTMVGLDRTAPFPSDVSAEG